MYPNILDIICPWCRPMHDDPTPGWMREQEVLDTLGTRLTRTRSLARPYFHVSRCLSRFFPCPCIIFSRLRSRCDVTLPVCNHWKVPEKQRLKSRALKRMPSSKHTAEKNKIISTRTPSSWGGGEVLPTASNNELKKISEKNITQSVVIHRRCRDKNFSLLRQHESNKDNYGVPEGALHVPNNLRIICDMRCPLRATHR